MGKKQVVALVICLVVIAVAVFTIIREKTAKPKAQKRALRTNVRCIDVDSLEVAEMAWGDWEALPLKDEESGYRVKDGKTLALAVKCPHCGKFIPAPYDEPPHKCPRCGKEFE